MFARVIRFNKIYKYSLKKMNSSYMNIEKSNQDIILTPNEGYDATLVWLHGLGDSALGYKEIFESNYRPVPNRVKVILLTAPVAPVTINNGMTMTSWYDIKKLDGSEGTVAEGDVIKNSLRIRKIIENEAKKSFNGDYKKVFLGGFSQGCAMTLHTGLTLSNDIGGLICLSGYLFPFTELISERKDVPIFIAHGYYDELIPESKAKESYKRLTEMNFNFTYKTYNEEHSISLEEFEDMKNFISKLL